MNLRRIAGLIALPILITIDRFAYYGMRSILYVQLTESGHGLALSTSSVMSVVRIFTVLVALAPLVGGLFAIVVAPRIVMIAGAAIGACGMALIPLAQNIPMLYLAFAVVALGHGLFAPCLFAEAGALFPAKRENERNALFAVLYAALNLGAVLAPMTSSAVMERLGGAVAIGVSSALMGSVTILAIGYVVAIAFLPAGDPGASGEVLDAEPIGPASGVAGAAALLFLFMPYTVMTALTDNAQYAAIGSLGMSGTRSEFLYSLNPIVIVSICPLLAILFVALRFAGVRVSTWWVIGAGLLVAAMAAIPSALAPGAATVAIACMAAGAVAETLIGPFGLSRVSAGTHPRASTMVVAVWMVTSSGLTTLLSLLPAEGMVPRVVLGGVTFLCFACGIVALVAARPFARFAYPEVEESAAALQV